MISQEILENEGRFEVDVKYRMPLQGSYSTGLWYCPECGYNNMREHSPRTIIGFAEDQHGRNVRIHRCGKCFELYYHHTTKDVYDMFLIYKEEVNNAEN